MILQPLRNNSRQQSVLGSASTPAPTGGWNARDNIANMKPDEALILDNWFPEAKQVTLRNGYSEHATDFGVAQIETLLAYASGTVNRLFACTSVGEIYDVTVRGEIDSPESVVISSSRIQYVNFGTVGGNFIMCVNGEDDPFNYNGSTWQNTPAITGSGLVPSNLIHVNVFKNRLFFVEKNTLKFWYLPVSSIGGTAQEFDLSSLCVLGGYLMAMGTWSRDGGDGIDDLAVFITSKGEVIIYQGTDPGDADAWALVGVFRIGAPVGRRCLFKLGGDLIIISQDGFLPLSRVLGTARTDKGAVISNKIERAVTEATRLYGDNYGWQAILYPRGNMGIFNVPLRENNRSHQYVVNTTTGAWCRFTGQNAICWEVFNDELYFGAASSAPHYCGVYKADSGQSDAGANREGDMQPAFSYFGSRGRLKRFTNVRPVFTTNGIITAAIALNVDFEDRLPDTIPTFSGTGGSPWDSSPWDTSAWGAVSRITKDWQSVRGLGNCGTIRMKVATSSLDLSLNAIDWLFEEGGFL